MTIYFIVAFLLFITVVTICLIYDLYVFAKDYKQYLKRCSKGKVYCEDCTYTDDRKCLMYIKHEQEREEGTHYDRPKIKIRNYHGYCVEKNINNDCKDFKPMNFYKYWLQDKSSYYHNYEYIED